MACINNISFYSTSRKNKDMAVYVSLKPAGEVRVDVPLPPKFFDAIMEIAQTAANAHEAKMRAEILGDSTTNQSNDGKTNG